LSSSCNALQQLTPSPFIYYCYFLKIESFCSSQFNICSPSSWISFILAVEWFNERQVSLLFKWPTSQFTLYLQLLNIYFEKKTTRFWIHLSNNVDYRFVLFFFWFFMRERKMTALLIYPRLRPPTLSPHLQLWNDSNFVYFSILVIRLCHQFWKIDATWV